MKGGRCPVSGGIRMVTEDNVAAVPNSDVLDLIRSEHTDDEVSN